MVKHNHALAMDGNFQIHYLHAASCCIYIISYAPQGDAKTGDGCGALYCSLLPNRWLEVQADLYHKAPSCNLLIWSFQFD